MIKIGEKYTGNQLKKEGVFPSWHKYAKSRCKWEVLEFNQIKRNTHGGGTDFAFEVTMRGKPKTKTGKIRKNPIKLKWVYTN